ncbi:MAG: dienelactone hydrolase family protein [Chloroflexi bacterium]|nr:dienelactone hydrolase family protein [Chloroflexota bacterium]
MMITAQESPRVRLGFVLRITVFAAVALLLILPTALGAGFMATLIAPLCTGGFDPAQVGLAYEEVSFPSSEFGRPTPAYFIPPASTADPRGATVIVLPTGAASRGDRIGEILIYHEAGLNVLSYASRTCVGGAANTLGDREADQVADALAYLATRPDVDPAHIGLHGFSAGGAAALLAAARIPQVAAVVAQGGYEDFPAQVDASVPANLGPLSPFFRFGAQMTYRLSTGNDWSRLSPVGVIASIAPRPVLLVYGTNEPGLAGGQRMRDLSHAELHVVEGAAHGNYLDFGPVSDDYRARVASFMRAALGAATSQGRP